jgi:hypothetical protein
MFITKLGNPHFSPELSAKTTVVNFTVTQKGLENQLLSRVISQEQASLEEMRMRLLEELNENTISLLELDKLLLDKLGSSKGDLLEDVELIKMLNETKRKSAAVKTKIESAKQTEININKKVNFLFFCFVFVAKQKQKIVSLFFPKENAKISFTRLSVLDVLLPSNSNGFTRQEKTIWHKSKKIYCSSFFYVIFIERMYIKAKIESVYIRAKLKFVNQGKFITLKITKKRILRISVIIYGGK